MQQKEREKQRMIRSATVQKEPNLDGAETELKRMDTVTSMTSSAPRTNVAPASVGTGASTQLVSSTHIMPTPHIVESQLTPPSMNVAQQREQNQMDALRAAAGLQETTGTTGPSQVTVTTTSAVVSV